MIAHHGIADIIQDAGQDSNGIGAEMGEVGVWIERHLFRVNIIEHAAGYQRTSRVFDKYCRSVDRGCVHVVVEFRTNVPVKGVVRAAGGGEFPDDDRRKHVNDTNNDD